MSAGGATGASEMLLSTGGTGPSGTKTATFVESCQVPCGEGGVGRLIRTSFP
jgi:hypothetical protein